MKRKEDIMMEHCSDNGLLNLNMGKHIIAAMEEYGKLMYNQAIEDAAKNAKIFEFTPMQGGWKTSVDRQSILKLKKWTNK